MTVRELKDYLEGYDDDADVGFAYNYGDHCKTTVIQKINDLDEYGVKYSEYFRMNVMLDEEEDEDGGAPRMVVLT